jgi:hypothetical protein
MCNSLLTSFVQLQTVRKPGTTEITDTCFFSFFAASRQYAEFDVLVTNPPYSGEHKPRLLQYLANVGKPFALLLPVYTATKSYWKEFAANSTSSPQGGSWPSVFYLIPPDSYEYRHPEGTGKDVPPFFSSWFIGGLGDSTARLVYSFVKITEFINSTPTHSICLCVNLFVGLFVSLFVSPFVNLSVIILVV